jgi:2',3'-cyclic-nucleotide 2'-phosphodiesterase (5'-nucleotidase family)
MKKPVVSLKHKFAKDGSTFKEISDKVLALRSTIDVLTIGNTIYFMNMSGENLFHMERAYRAICQNKMSEIRDAAIIADPTCFMSVACSGHNPRRFVSFNQQNLAYLQNAEARQRLATKFSIALTEDGMLNISDEKSAEKLVKLLCNKGMLNPFDDSPVEVSGARNWT